MKTFDEAVATVFSTHGRQGMEEARKLQTAFSEEAINNQALVGILQHYISKLQNRGVSIHEAEIAGVIGEQEMLDKVDSLFNGAFISVFLWGVATGREMEKVLPFDAAPAPAPVVTSVADASGDSGDFGSADFFNTLQELRQKTNNNRPGS